MEAFANQVVDLLNGLLWGKILIWLLVGTRLYFTPRLGFIQLRHFGHTFTVLRGSRRSDASGISSFQALCTSLAARVGTGVGMVQNALTSEVGGWGKYFLAIVVLFFAFTSIVANYFYAENCLVFIEHKHPAGLLIFRLIVLAMVMFGAIGSLPFVWNFADVAMGLMAITNLVAILLLSGLVVKLAKDYNAQRAAGKLPSFDAREYPEIRSRLEPGIWD
jgi:Na+/alanine symporter